ncbi:MAG: serine/threonine protein kinase, partial [Thermoanaerobaculia bacterium]
PENVMVSEERFVKLLDFGLAKQAFEAEADELTARRESNPTTPGAVMGTVGYMSPEQARGRPVDFRSDQFAFGTLLYEILTGVRPFQRDSWPETLAAIIAEEPVPVGQLNPRVPAPLARLVERCLEKAPDLRYGSTRDLEHELRDIRERGSGGEFAAGSPPALMPLTRARRLRWAAAIGVALLITTVGVTAWRVRGNAARGESLLAAESAVAELRSVAVFPFADLTGDENDALLAAGLSATVAAQLGRIENLQVLTATPAPELARSAAVAARELGARLVLTGTLQRSGDQIRVTYAIVDTHDGKQIAADTLTSVAGDLFGLQDQLSAKIGRALDADRTARPSSSPRMHDPALQTRYLQALGYLQRYEN